MIEIQRAEAKELGMENWNWETFMEVDSYKEASQQLAKLINDNDAIGDFFRVIESGTPIEDRCGREPDKAKRQDCADCLYPERSCSECINKAIEPDKIKSLVQYLDEYIEHEVENGNISPEVSELYAYGSWRELLEQALEAYESTQGVQIRIERVL